MQMRQFGRLWPVSALALGGAGLGHIWGETDRAEAVATVRKAVDSGINLIDVAPRYGNGEAEQVVGAAFGGEFPGGSVFRRSITWATGQWPKLSQGWSALS